MPNSWLILVGERVAKFLTKARSLKNNIGGIREPILSFYRWENQGFQEVRDPPGYFNFRPIGQ